MGCYCATDPLGTKFQCFEHISADFGTNGARHRKALEKLEARQALAALHKLLNDDGRSPFGEMVPVAGAARAAITALEFY